MGLGYSPFRSEHLSGGGAEMSSRWSEVTQVPPWPLGAPDGASSLDISALLEQM